MMGLKAQKKRGRGFLFLVLALVLLAGIAVSYAISEIGTAEDPAVTQSYVHLIVDPLIKQVSDLNTQVKKVTDQQKASEELADFKKQVDAFQEKISAMESLEGRLKVLEQSIDQKTHGVFEVFRLKQGDILAGGASTQIILRTGTARAMASVSGGLVDLTSDTQGDLKALSNVPLNHLILIPRDDGRGIRITSEEAWVMVSGKYEIKG
jgi:TolA-binding protein